MGYVHPLYGFIEDDDYDIDAAIEEQLEREAREEERREQELLGRSAKHDTDNSGRASFGRGVTFP